MTSSTTSPGNQHTILIVDDITDNIDILSSFLSQDYDILVALDGEKALLLIEKFLPDLILLDILMPKMDGYEVCRQLKNNPRTMNIPIIFITALNSEIDEEKGLNLGGVDFINKPIKPCIVKARVQTHLALYDQNKALEIKVRERTEALETNQLRAIQRLSRVAGYRFHGSSMHVMRISHYVYRVAEAMGLPLDWCDLLFNAVPMYDIGKLSLPDRILLNPNKLNDEEWALMQSHCELGSEIIGDPEDSSLFKLARSVALFHQEKYDGSGYPFAIKAEEIPLEGRIIVLCDVFEALTSKRVYRDAWSEDEALEYIKNESGKHFDPQVVEAFIKQWPAILAIKSRFSD